MASDLHQQFNEVLHKLISPDNEIRSSAEQVYESVPVSQRLEFLLSAMQDISKAVEMRNLSLVLLRRLFTGEFDEMWASLPAEHQAAVKQQMITSVRAEQDNSIRRKMCDALAELSRNLIDDEGNNQWLEVLQFLFECVHSNSSQQKDSALHIFSSVPGIFGSQQAQHLDVIKQMLTTCLADQSEVGFAAAKASCSFLVSNEGDQQILAYFRDLLPGIIQATTLSVQRREDDTLLKCIIDVAENIPKYLRPQLEEILTLCLNIISNKELDSTWRQLALEIVTTISETGSAMLRKHSKFIAPLIVIVLQLMCDLDDDTDWAIRDELEEEEADDNAVAGESALDRLACGLGGKTVLPHILSNVPPLLASPDWQCRHAALMAVSACGEGCHKQMEGMLGQIVASIIPYARDPHPRVRYAACNAMGQMATDFQPNFQKKYHAEVLPALLDVLDDNQNPRVQAHAGAALVNFCEECPKQILAPYLDRIISKLAEVLNNKFTELVQRGNKLVLEQIVTTLATVADAAEDKFIDYYDRFMPSLKVIIQNTAVNNELKLLRGKSIECVSLIGLAVGRDKFMQDCGDVMKLLLESQTVQEFADDDPQVSYLISAWARMCKILGKEFQQFLPMVMPPVLKAASIKPEVAVLDSDEMKALENDSDWQFVTLGDSQNFGIRTAGLEDKATACQMLVCYARELKEGFAPYTQQVLEIMVPLLKFYFHDDCRVAAAESLPYLIDCAQLQGPQYLQSMWDMMLPNLLKAIESEPEKDIQAEVLSSLAQCIERLGKGCLGENYTQDLVRIIIVLLDDHFKREEGRQELRKDEDYDDVVEENLLNENDEDVYLLSKISDVIHALFGTSQEAALPVFEQLLLHFVKLLKGNGPWPDRQWGLCIFDDCLEFAGPSSYKYHEYFVGPMLDSLTDRQPEVRQAAAYGIGVMAQHGGSAYNETLKESLPRLVAMIHSPDSRNLDNINATENAISAVTKMCKFSQGAINQAEVIPMWRHWLPVWEDIDEAEYIYGFFCDLFESRSPLLFGEDGSFLMDIVRIIAQCFSMEVTERGSELHNRLKGCMTSLQSTPALQTCIEHLQPDQRASLIAEMSR